MKILISGSILILLMGLAMAVKNIRKPSALGVANGKLAPLPKTPNAVSSQTDDPRRRVAPFPFKKHLGEAKADIKRALQAYGNIVIESESKDYIHAVSTTQRMKFRDDLEFLFDEKEKVVHFRSASRVGYSDLGLNAKRYHDLAKFYESSNPSN